MAILVPKKIETKKLMAYLAIIIIMTGGIVFFIFKIRSSVPTDVKLEPTTVPNELIEVEPVGPEQDNGTINQEVGEEKTEENLNTRIFNDPRFKALKDNSLN